MGKKRSDFESVLKWHEKAASFEKTTDLHGMPCYARPALTAAHADESALVTADGYRVHVTYGDYRDHADEQGYIPFKKSEGYSDRSFVNWQRVIPESFEVRVTVPREQFAQAVKLADIFSRDSNHAAAFTLQTTGLYVAGYSLERGDVQTFVPAESSDPAHAFTVYLNADFVLDALSGFDADRVTLHLTAADQPVGIGEPGVKLAVLMPMSAWRDTGSLDTDPTLADRADGWQKPKSLAAINKPYTKNPSCRNTPSLDSVKPAETTHPIPADVYFDYESALAKEIKPSEYSTAKVSAAHGRVVFERMNANAYFSKDRYTYHALVLERQGGETIIKRYGMINTLTGHGKHWELVSTRRIPRVLDLHKLASLLGDLDRIRMSEHAALHGLEVARA